MSSSHRTRSCSWASGPLYRTVSRLSALGLVVASGFALTVASAASASPVAVSLAPVSTSPSGTTVLPRGTLPTVSAVTDRRPASCPIANTDPNTGSGLATQTGQFPWPAASAGTSESDWASNPHTPATAIPERPANWSQGGGDVKLTSARSSQATLAGNPQELCGVEGNSADVAWQTTAGRPSTVIAVTDSGIEWCDPALVDKIYLNRAALPPPENAQGDTKAQLESAGQQFDDTDPYDLDGSAIFNVEQYANDPRIAKPYFCATAGGDGFGYTGISPADLIATFGTPGGKYYAAHSGPAGFTDAIAGWDFVDDNNNPYDAVHYDHGTGTAEDATGAAGTLAQEVGSCPDCMVMPIKVGDSFITSGNAFAEGALFAVDSGATVIQEALGTYDVTESDTQAITYAEDHGVPWWPARRTRSPSTTTFLRCSRTPSWSTASPTTAATRPPSYLYLNGCTNYGANISVSVESNSCSSEATGKTGGIVGLAESAAAVAMGEHVIAPYPGLHTVTGAPVALSTNEITQLVTMSADDIDFATAAPPNGPAQNTKVSAALPLVSTQRDPTGTGLRPHQRVRTDRRRPSGAVDRFGPHPSPGRDRRSALVPGALPFPARDRLGGDGDDPESFVALRGAGGAGRDAGQVGVEGGSERLRARGAHRRGGPGSPVRRWPPSSPGRPSSTAHRRRGTANPFRTSTCSPSGSLSRTRREWSVWPGAPSFSTRTPSLVNGAPTRFSSSIAAPPVLAPIGPGWDQRPLGGDRPTEPSTPTDPTGRTCPVGRSIRHPATGFHSGEEAYTSHQVPATPRGEIVGGLAVGDLADASGHDLDVVATDLTGRVWAWNAEGQLLPGWPVRTDPAFSGPGVTNKDNEVLRGILGAPVLGDLQGNGTLDVIAASMDRHVYAWQPGGEAAPGWPVDVVDPNEVQSVDSSDGQVTFLPGAQGDTGTKLVDTPAIAQLVPGGPPEVVVTSNEQYDGTPDASLGTLGVLFSALGALSSAANSRVYAIWPDGSLHAPSSGAPNPPGYPNPGAFLPGWPVAIADLDPNLLPDIGDGASNGAAVATVPGSAPLIAVESDVGPVYLLHADGSSALGTTAGLPNVLSSGPSGAESNSTGLVATSVPVPGSADHRPARPGIG